MKYSKFKFGIRTFILLFVCVFQIMCRNNEASSSVVDLLVQDGNKIIYEINIYKSKENKVPDSITDLDLQTNDWIYIRLDDESYILTKHANRRKARVEYRYGELHHGVDFVGWFYLNGDTLIKL